MVRSATLLPARGNWTIPSYLSLLRDVEVPLIAHGLSEQQVPWSLAFLRAAKQRSNRKRLLCMEVG
jgi:hypothetical protein